MTEFSFLIPLNKRKNRNVAFATFVVLDSIDFYCIRLLSLTKKKKIIIIISIIYLYVYIYILCVSRKKIVQVWKNSHFCVYYPFNGLFKSWLSCATVTESFRPNKGLKHRHLYGKFFLFISSKEELTFWANQGIVRNSIIGSLGFNL